MWMGVPASQTCEGKDRELIAYAFAARIPVLIVMFFAMRGGWGTHYDAVEARFGGLLPSFQCRLPLFLNCLHPRDGGSAGLDDATLLRQRRHLLRQFVCPQPRQQQQNR